MVIFFPQQNGSLISIFYFICTIAMTV